MVNYILRRIVQAIPVLFLVTAIVFLVIYFVPGDPAMVVLGQGASEANLAAMRHTMGLDKPLPERYWIWLEHAVRLDLGDSYLNHQPVKTLIARAFPITLYLAIFSLLISVLISVPTGTLAALHKDTWIDVVCTIWALAGVSLPGFWLAIMLLYVFGVELQWVPVRGYVGLREDLSASLRTMVLPAFTLGVFLSGPQMRYLRSSILNTVSQDYVQVARAKGLAERRVIFSHILRNSMMPFLTAVGIQFGYLMGGAVVVEHIFALPGIGQLAVNSIGDRDIPIVQGITLTVAVCFVLINIAVDVLYAVLDPRIRVGRGAT
jgi:peptide/nickel transport system permease protein